MRWTVVAGYGGSASSADAIALSRSVLDAAADQLIVGCVYEYRTLGGRFASGEGAAAVARQGCEAAQSGRAEPTAVPGVSPADGLCRLAVATHAHLVVGSARRALRGRLLRGSTADGLLRRDVCAVAMAPAGYRSHRRRFKTVGVVFDGTLPSRAAVRTVAADSRKTLDLLIASSRGRFRIPWFRRHRGGRWIRACRCPVLILPGSKAAADDSAAAADREKVT